MKIQLLRHATLILDYADYKFLIDPMFSPAGANPPIADTPNQQRNPLVDLTLDDQALQGLLADIDAVIVTHTHGDHWDAAAQRRLLKTTPIFCQPQDLQKIRGAGFQAAQALEDSLAWGPIQLSRTGGQHGRGEIGRLMAPVSGFVWRSDDQPTLYVAGDTIWCAEVEAAIRLYQPEVIVVNAGAAQFNTGGPITMAAEDVLAVAQAAPQATVIAVHMEVINHCLLRREQLRQAVDAAGISARIKIPVDGQVIVQ